MYLQAAGAEKANYQCCYNTIACIVNLRDNLMRLYIERRVLYRGNIGVLTLWFCDWQTRCGDWVLTLRVNTGLQSELRPPALCGQVGDKFKNIIYTGIKTVMYEKLPLRQSLVKIGGWLAMAAPNWTNSVSHDPVTRGGGWCVTGTRSRQNDKHLQYLQPRETSCSVHTHTSHNWEDVPSKVGCQDTKISGPKIVKNI